MNKSPMFLPVILLLSWISLHNVPVAVAETAASYKSEPPFASAGAPPLVMLVMGRDHKLYYEAYNDASDLNDDGILDIRYNPAINYYGYFDSYKCYTYSSGDSRFNPISKTTDKKCNGQWSGDFLNYLTMSRMDTMRKVLYGGYRSSDPTVSTDPTVLERVYIPQEGHSWGKEYTSVAIDGYDIAQYTPLTTPTGGNRHFFASTTRTGVSSPPVLIYVLNQTDRIWKWVAKERPCIDPRTNEVILTVRVKVCDSSVGLEANCQQYPDGNYKPTGILQRYGESDWDATATPPAYKAPKMYFGLMSGSYAKNTQGGVLRKKMGNISDEIQTKTTGVFDTSVNGIIQTINKLRIYGYDYGSQSYNSDCGWITNGPMGAGKCRDWGNPIAEIMYETERYFAGKKSATSTFNYSGTTDDSNLLLPKDTWNDPYDTADGGFPSCAKPFMLVLSDINPNFDSDQLPGVNSNFGGGITNDLPGPGLNVSSLATTISTKEGISSDAFIGQSGTVSNYTCSAKSITGLSSIRGLCPEEPTKQGSYYSASVAYYGHITDLRPPTTIPCLTASCDPFPGDQKITTYSIGLASPLPKIELKVGPDKKLVTLVPFGKTIGNIGNTNLWAYSPTNTIVEFFVEAWTPTYGKFNINFEDVEQGADHDMDAIVTYEYQLVNASDAAVSDPLDATKVKITLNSDYAKGDYIQHLGYIISGTTADGPYLDVRDKDTVTDLLSPFDTPIPPLTMLPLTATRYFTPGAGATATQLLTNPLWYAAKWGAYDEKDGVQGPTRQDEWDKDQNGVPDTYFYVNNPLKLEEQLNKSFADILRRTSSGTVASVISGSRSGEGAVYQSVFYPEYSDFAPGDNKITWAGSVHASFVDSLGRMREDTPVPDTTLGIQNHILDKKDKVLVFKKDTTTGTLSVEKFSLVDGIAEKTSVTFLTAASDGMKGKYFRLNAVDAKFYVWFTFDGNGTDPQPADMTGIPVALAASDTTGDAVATKTMSALSSKLSHTFDVTRATNVITITNKIPGAVEDATTSVPGTTILKVTEGAGETTNLVFTGTAEDIKYLWNSSTWLNSPAMDANITTQRPYNTVANQRHIITFIDVNNNKIADDYEQVDFVAGTNLPSVADLQDSSTLFPYIPVNSDSENLPAYVVGAYASNLEEFLRNQTQRVINYIRGQDQPTQVIGTAPTNATIPAFRSRKLDLDKTGPLETTWRLGDIVYSSPTVVSKPQEALHLLYKDGTYATFADKYKQRRTVVYTGANDGMLHAFNGGFYEDRFDVYPTDLDPTNTDPNIGDGIKDAQFLLQPKNPAGTTISSGYAAHPLGSELWAYIPYNLLPHLYWLTQPDYAHVYYVDLKPRIFDAKIFPADTDHPGGWGTVLVGGMRFGGGKINVDMNRMDGNVNNDDRKMTSAFFVLDITNPEVPPTVLGEVNFPHLGYTTCYPTVATMKDKVETASSPNKWFLIFGSGPAEADGSPGPATTSGTHSLTDAVSLQKAKLYVVDLVEMAKPAASRSLKTIDTSGYLTTPNALTGYYKEFTSDNNAFISDPITVDYDLDYKADAVYFGTESFDGTSWGGRLRRIVINNNINSQFWTGDSTLIDLEKNTSDPTVGTYQPITAAPAVGLDSDGNNWVYFGTGRYYVRNDKDIFAQQAFYGIKEPKNASHVNTYVPVERTTLYNSTNIEVNTATTVVSNTVTPVLPVETSKTWKDFVTASKLFPGWYYNFPDTLERNLGQAALFGDLTTFTSYVPSADTCTPEGSSFLYALHYLTGTAAYVPAIGTNVLIDTKTYNRKRIPLGKGLVSKPSVHVGKKDGSTAYVQSSDGAIITVEEANPGMTKSGKTAWSQRE